MILVLYLGTNELVRSHNTRQWWIQDSPSWEAKPSGDGRGEGVQGSNIRYCQISQKLHEIERTWTPGGGGGRGSKILLCRSATARDPVIERKKKSMWPLSFGNTGILHTFYTTEAMALSSPDLLINLLNKPNVQ